MRNTFLVSYDITADRRRTKVFKKLRGYGDHIQYSVFLCDLTRRERVKLEGEVTGLINCREDQLLIVDLGPAQGRGEKTIKWIGVPLLRSPVACKVL